MSPSKTRNGGRPASRTPAATQITAATKPQLSAAHDSATPPAGGVTAVAVRYLASGDAAFDWLVVPRCPLCSYPHRHVLFERAATVVERHPPCAPHRTYLVEITQTVPAAQPLRRREGAA